MKGEGIGCWHRLLHVAVYTHAYIQTSTLKICCVLAGLDSMVSPWLLLHNIQSGLRGKRLEVSTLLSVPLVCCFSGVCYTSKEQAMSQSMYTMHAQTLFNSDYNAAGACKAHRAWVHETLAKHWLAEVARIWLACGVGHSSRSLMLFETLWLL